MPAFLKLGRNEFLNSAHIIDFVVSTIGGDTEEGVMNGYCVLAAVTGEDNRRIIARQLTEDDAKNLVAELIISIGASDNQCRLFFVDAMRAAYPTFTFPTHAGWRG